MSDEDLSKWFPGRKPSCNDSTKKAQKIEMSKLSAIERMKLSLTLGMGKNLEKDNMNVIKLRYWDEANVALQNGNQILALIPELNFREDFFTLFDEPRSQTVSRHLYRFLEQQTLGYHSVPEALDRALRLVIDIPENSTIKVALVEV